MASGLSLYVGATPHRPQHERGPGGMGPSDFGLGTELLDGIVDEAAGAVHGLRRSQTESARILFFFFFPEGEGCPKGRAGFFSWQLAGFVFSFLFPYKSCFPACGIVIQERTRVWEDS